MCVHNIRIFTQCIYIYIHILYICDYKCVAPTNEMIYHSPQRTKHLSHGRLFTTTSSSSCIVPVFCLLNPQYYLSLQHSSIWKDPTMGFREPSSFMLDVPEASLGETASDVRQVRWSIPKTKMSEIQSEKPQLLGVSENSVPLNPMVNDHYPY